jgi:hypothetical protein
MGYTIWGFADESCPFAKEIFKAALKIIICAQFT